MYLHILRFQTRDELAWALGQLLDAADVDGCIASPDALELRVCAQEHAVDKLVEHFYERGGLTWATRHPMRA